MQNAKFVFNVMCGIVLVACSTTSSTTAANNGDASGGAGEDGGNGTPTPTPTPGDDSGAATTDDGGQGNPLGGFGGDATITCKGMADCGGAGHACCFSIMSFATRCVTGSCGSDYTQCVSGADCPAGLQCAPSPLGAGIKYCAGGEGGAGDGGGGDGGTAEDAPSDGGTSSTSDGASE
jgi:hypothetical protein